VSANTEQGVWHRASPACRQMLACLALVALTLCTFGNTLWNQFISFDDWFLVEENERIRSLAPRSIAAMLVSKDPSSHAWLPLRELSYAVDYAFWGLNPVGYHLTNVLLHAANTVLCYGVLRWLLRRQGLALLGAAAFAVHPAQVESVAWVSGRRDVLYALFYLLAFLAFVAHERREGRGRWVLYGLSLACLAASLLSKASAMTLPAALGLAVLTSGDGSDERLWGRLAATLPHWVLAIGLTAVHTLVAHEAGIVKGQAFDASLANVPLIFAKYWQLLFFPVHLVAPHGEGSLRWASDGPRIALLAAAAAAVVLAAWWAAPRRSSAAFCIGWWFLLLLPVANFIPISVLVAERYLYLPLVGACAFGAELLGSVMTTRRRAAVALGCTGAVLATLALGAHSRNRVWADSRTFWQDGVSKWPGIPVMRIGLATAYLDANDYERAWEQYMDVSLAWGRAASLDPDHVSLVNRGLEKFYDTLARRREAEGRKQAALEVYETMTRLLPKNVEAYARLARAYERQGLYAKAREQVIAVQKLDAEYPGLAAWLRRLDHAERGQGGERPKE